MKTLSVRQPYASLLCAGIKDIESALETHEITLSHLNSCSRPKYLSHGAEDASLDSQSICCLGRYGLDSLHRRNANFSHYRLC